MHVSYFTEQPLTTYPEDEATKFGESVLMFSNKWFDRGEASRLYNERLEEYLYAEEVGLDGIMLNEHHNVPYCMQAKANIFAAVLAGMTKRVDIILLGNPMPISDNPVRIAEEVAMIDSLSKGRVVSGIVRATGKEYIATNTNPAFTWELMEEAHDLLIKTWTEPGPWRWEGNHYQFRVVNPWVLPLQEPHPRVFVPGVISNETIVWAAKHRYPYVGLNTTIEQTKKIFEVYSYTAAQVGYKAGPENLGYLIRCHVAETEEKALQNGREFMWMGGNGRPLMGHAVWDNPPGYGSPTTRRNRLNFTAKGEGFDSFFPPFEKQLENGDIIAGTPAQVIDRLRIIMEEIRPSILILWGNDGKTSHEDSMSCIRLMGQEVMPAVKEIGDKLGIKSPFELNSPVSLQFTPKEQLKPFDLPGGPPPSADRFMAKGP